MAPLLRESGGMAAALQIRDNETESRFGVVAAALRVVAPCPD